MPTLNVQVFNQHAPYNSGIANVLRFVPAEFYVPLYHEEAFVYGPNDPAALPYATFLDDDTAIAAFTAAGGSDILSQVNAAIGSSYYGSYNVITIDAPVVAYVSHYVPNTTTVNGHALTSNVAVAYGDLTGTPSFSAVATSGSYSDLSGKPTIPTVNAPSFANPSRSTNTAFQVSATRDAAVSYSVDITCTMSLTSGQKGTAYLRYADDSGHTTNVVTVARGSNSNSGSLTIGLNLTQIGTVNLHGMVPAGKYAKVVTVQDTGTPSFAIQNAQEVLV